ncbi:MAG: DNA topoisomerase IB [Gemmatimonadaceae bacterium]
MAQQWILRKGSKDSGFRYLGANGRKVASKELVRIDALRIPPAWKDVHVAVSSRAPVQAWGFDARGRKQYRYHTRAVEKGELAKHYRVRQLASDLPKLRRTLRDDFGRGDFSKERVFAGIVLLISDAFFRVGSDRYERENNTFGVTTLRKSHVKIVDDSVEFDFRGKRSIRQKRPYKASPRMLAFIRSMMRTPGQRLFRYKQDGEWVNVTARDVNEYIRSLADFPYTAKDFRTWGGTLRMAIVLADLPEGKNERARKKSVAQAVRFVASELHNTPAIARKSYVHPVLITRYVQNGATIEVRHPTRSMRSEKRFRHTPEERALIDFLAQYFPERRKERRPVDSEENR